jgi:hypothetical protein
VQVHASERPPSAIANCHRGQHPLKMVAGSRQAAISSGAEARKFRRSSCSKEAYQGARSALIKMGDGADGGRTMSPLSTEHDPAKVMSQGKNCLRLFSGDRLTSSAANRPITAVPPRDRPPPAELETTGMEGFVRTPG